MGLGNLNSGQAKACPVIVPRWESGHVHLVMEQVFGGSPLLSLRLQSSGPVWRMAEAVIMGDLQGTLLLGPCPTFSSSHSWMLCGSEEVLCPVRCSLPSGCEQYPPAPTPHHGPFFF